MKTIETIKRGDEVFVYSSDSRNQNYEATVKSIGPKFITLDGIGRWMSKFCKRTLVCEEWTSYHLFLGTKEEYENFHTTEDERERLAKEIPNLIKGFSLEQLKDLREYISGVNQ